MVRETTRDRIEVLFHGGVEPHLIAAHLGLDVTDVALTLADANHTPEDPAGSGLSVSEPIVLAGEFPFNEPLDLTGAPAGPFLLLAFGVVSMDLVDKGEGVVELTNGGLPVDIFAAEYRGPITEGKLRWNFMLKTFATAASVVEVIGAGEPNGLIVQSL